MLSLYVVLVLTLCAGALLLRYWPGPSGAATDPIERSFNLSTSFLERRRLRSLVRSLPTSRERHRLAEVRRVRDESRIAPLPVVRARRFNRGIRNVCAFQLPDGRQVELSVYEAKVADRVVRSWQRNPTTALRLSWMGEIGWCCSLHDVHGLYDPATVKALGWEVAVTLLGDAAR